MVDVGFNVVATTDTERQVVADRAKFVSFKDTLPSGTNGDMLVLDSTTTLGFKSGGAPPASVSFTAGMIMLWSGTIATIPAGWVLCDGNNGTPNLVDRFVVCAKQDDAGVAKTNITGSLTQSGGSISYTPAGTQGSPTISNHGNHTHSVTSNVTVDNHAAHNHGVGTLTTANESAHTHSINHTHLAGTKGGTGTAVNDAPYTGNSGAGSAHNHTVSGNTDNNVAQVHVVTNNAVTSGNESATLTHTVSAPGNFTGTAATIIPPYYALAYIMKT